MRYIFFSPFQKSLEPVLSLSANSQNTTKYISIVCTGELVSIQLFYLVDAAARAGASPALPLGITSSPEPQALSQQALSQQTLSADAIAARTLGTQIAPCGQRPHPP